MLAIPLLELVVKLAKISTHLIKLLKMGFTEIELNHFIKIFSLFTVSESCLAKFCS